MPNATSVPDRTVAFRRVLADREALVVFNAGDRPATVDLASDALLSSALQPVCPPDADETEGLPLNGTPEPVTIPAREARGWINASGGSKTGNRGPSSQTLAARNDPAAGEQLEPVVP